MDSLEIIALCKKGDPRAWEGFIKQYGPFAQNIVRKYFPVGLEDLENITQNIFIKLYEGGMVHFRGTTLYEFRAYYKTIVLNETKSYLKNENRWKDKIEDLFPAFEDTDEEFLFTKNPIENIDNQSPKPDHIAEEKEMAKIVDKVLENFSLNERQVFLLKIKGYKEKEISKIVGIPMGSVASSYSRMVEKIQDLLKKMV